MRILPGGFDVDGSAERAVFEDRQHGDGAAAVVGDEHPLPCRVHRDVGGPIALRALTLADFDERTSLDLEGEHLAAAFVDGVDVAAVL